MNRFSVSALALAGGLTTGLVGSAHADAQCAIHEGVDGGGLACLGPLSAAETGDDSAFFQNQLSARPGIAEALIEELDADIEPLRTWGLTFAADLANPAGGVRRFVNAALLLDVIQGPDGLHWLEWVTDYTACFWFMNHCGDSGGLNGEASGLGSVALTPNAIHRSNPIERAGVMVHEAGHHFEGHISDDDCPAHVSCDESYEDDGPQANQIDFLMATKAQLNSLPDPLWEEVRVGINSKLNAHFARHSGFNLGRPDAYYNGAYRTVRFDEREGWTEATFFPDPDRAPEAITGLGLTVAGGQVVRMRLRLGALDREGRLTGATRQTNVGLQLGAALEQEVLLPAGYVATGLLVRATDTAVTHLGLVGHRLIAQPGGVLVNEVTVWSNGLATAAPETSFRSRSGHFLTGLGLRMVDGNVTVHAFKESLPRGFTATVGGDGGSPSSAFCSDTDRIIGLSTGVGGVGADQSVDFFGLICARKADVDARMAPASAARTVIFTGYFDEERQIERAPGVASYFQMASVGPVDKQTRFCPAGASIERVAVYHNNLVRKVAWFQCTDNTVISVDQGINQGSYTHLTCTQDPVTGEARPLVVNGLRARSGWRLDGLTLHCTLD